MYIRKVLEITKCFFTYGFNTVSHINIYVVPASEFAESVFTDRSNAVLYSDMLAVKAVKGVSMPRCITTVRGAGAVIEHSSFAVDNKRLCIRVNLPIRLRSALIRRSVCKESFNRYISARHGKGVVVKQCFAAACNKRCLI